jgi:hypothetical protein
MEPLNKVDLAKQARERRNIQMFMDSITYQLAMASPGQIRQLDEAAASLRHRYRDYYKNR